MIRFRRLTNWNYICFFFALSVFHLEYGGLCYYFNLFCAMVQVIILVYLLLFEHSQADKCCMLVLLLSLYTVLITIINKGDISSTIRVYISVFNAICIGSKLITEKDYRSLKICCFVFNAFSLIQFFDIYRNFNIFLDYTITRLRYTGLLGFQNGFGSYFIPIFAINLYLFSLNENIAKKVYYLLFALISASIGVEVWSVTTVFCSIIIVICLLISKVGFTHFEYLILGAYVFFGLFVVLEVTDFEIIKTITSWMGRDITFSGRTQIWYLARKTIGDSWVLGAGRNFNEGIKSFNGVSLTHNQLLDILYLSGLFGTIVFNLCIILCIKKQRMDVKKNQILFISFASMFLCMQFESFAGYYGYCMFFFLMGLCNGCEERTEFIFNS